MWNGQHLQWKGSVLSSAHRFGQRHEHDEFQRAGARLRLSV
jgi:hypothetical protein